MTPDSAISAKDAAAREREEAARREYERKLDRDLRIMRVVLPVLCVVASVMMIALAAYLIVYKL